MDRAQAIPASGPLPKSGLLIALGAAVLVLAFAWAGPTSWLGLGAIGVAILAFALVLPVPVRVLVVAALAPTILLGQVEAAVWYFDAVPITLGAIAVVLTLARGDRDEWNLTTAGWLSLAWLAVPWIAVPFTVVSSSSFLGAYKIQVLFVLLFHALRRIIPREHSHLLLFAFPLVGVIGTLQLLAKTQGLGALLFARMGFRNFYSRLPWGQSDFISAVLEFSICGTILLLVLVRSPWVRLLLVGAIVLILQGFLILFSRAGVIGLGLFMFVVALGFGGRKGWLVVAGTVAAALVGLTTMGGQVTAARFTDPNELGSVAYRLVLWAIAWTRFIGHPWTGIGMNQGKYQHDLQGGEWSSNFLLDVVTETGIPGGIVFVLILVGIFVVASRIVPVGFTGSPRPIRAITIGTLVQILAHGAVETTINGPPMSVLLVYLLAWMMLQDRPPPATARPAPAPAARPLVAP